MATQERTVEAQRLRDEIAEANAHYVENVHHERMTGQPRRRLAILTCMDARIDPAAVFGLHEGEAHVMRNAGARVTDDVLRSLALSQMAMHTEMIMVVQQTSCGLHHADEGALRTQFRDELGVEFTMPFLTFGDQLATMRADLARLRDCPWLKHRDAVWGYLYDVLTGTLTPVE